MSNAPSYKVFGTKIVSPYPVRLTPAETRLVFTLQKLFSPQHIFVDLYLPSATSSTDLTQIDCLAIGQQGIFVFESKDYSGWIYGRGNDRYWTQTLNFGREKHSFYNPVRQNSTHIKALADLVDARFSIYSFVVFGHETVLKQISHLPERCYVCTSPQLPQLIHILKSPYLLQTGEIDKLSQDFAQARVNPNTIIRNQHVQEINEKFTKS